MQLKAIGFWHSDDESLFIHPKNCIGNFSSDEERQKLINYLEHGHYLIDYMGYSYCRLCSIETQEMGASEQTDGIWVWPEGLKHYVEKHSVLLTNEFMEHAKSNNWQVPDYTPINYTKYDYDYCKNT